MNNIPLEILIEYLDFSSAITTSQISKEYGAIVEPSDINKYKALITLSRHLSLNYILLLCRTSKFLCKNISLANKALFDEYKKAETTINIYHKSFLVLEKLAVINCKTLLYSLLDCYTNKNDEHWFELLCGKKIDIETFETFSKKVNMPAEIMESLKQQLIEC